MLGQGSFALVKLATDRQSGEERALKIIAKRPLKEGNENMLEEEIEILGRVEHPHIIKMWDLWETKEAVFIVTDLCRGGELFDRLVEKVFYNELDARHITRQIFEAIAYLHDHDVIHRDLKPENILLRNKDEPSEIVISDFGLSKLMSEDGHLLMTACGSPQYVAPEVLLGKGYGASVDIWSGGVIAYCLLAGYTPFYGDDQPTLFQHILSMKVEFEPEYWSAVSDNAKDFICKCLCPADKRMTAHEALKHPYLSDLPSLDAHESSRGCCLKESARRHHESAKSKLSRVITTVEATNYLKHLHDLRQKQGVEMPPEKLQSLLRLQTQLSLTEDKIGTENADDDKGNGAGKEDEDRDKDAQIRSDKTLKATPRGDSGMSLDLVVMMAHVPDPPKMTGTASVAAAANATQHGENPVSVEGDSSKANPAPGSPSPSSSGYSDDTATPTPPRQRAAAAAGGRTKSRRHPPSRTASKRSDKSRDGSSNTLDALLDQYRSTSMPATARTNPAVQPTPPSTMTLAKAWRYVPFLVNSGISIGSAIASHAFYGPPKRSWGIEMSVFTRIMRDAAAYTEFATVAGLQQFFELSSFLPVPKDGLITPVTWRIKKRGLRGILKEFDEQEDGTREMTGEWVVGKQTWRRLQSEWRNGKQANKERVILYIHGGAYYVMSAVTHRPLTISLSKYTECRLFAINYRLAPDCKFPGPLHDVVSSWFRLVDDLGIPPQNIVLGGDSAGGGLTLALLYYLRDNGYELPSGAILFSPWVDLTMSCDSWETNAKFDYLPMPQSSDHMNPVRAYLGDNIEKYLTHPYASPLFGDLHGLPPLLIQCGDAEVLRDEITLLAHKASMAGVAVRHELYEDCVHVFPAFLFLDASRKALQSARHFVRTALDKRGKRKVELQSKGRNEMMAEMRKGMENELGEEVEPTTGEKRGSWRAARGGVESDVDDAQGGNLGRSEDEWNDFDDEPSGAGQHGSAAAVRKTEPNKSATAPSDTVDSSQVAADGMSSTDMQRSKSEADTAAGVFSGDLRKHPRARPASGVPSASGAPAASRSPRASLPSSPLVAHRSSGSGSVSGVTGSLSGMSLEQARSRAQAGLRLQESREAPHLSKFHTPQRPLQPRMRRSASNATIHDLVESWTKGQSGSGLNTRVFTPGSANSGENGESGP